MQICKTFESLKKFHPMIAFIVQRVFLLLPVLLLGLVVGPAGTSAGRATAKAT
jgi:hypothetical protein